MSKSLDCVPSKSIRDKYTGSKPNFVLVFSLLSASVIRCSAGWLQICLQTVANWEARFPLFFLQRQQRNTGGVLAVEAGTLGRVVIKIDVALITVFSVV